jgi:hypothetical protein
MLPLVKDAIAQIQGIGDTRPKKVTKLAVEKFLNLPSKRIDKLPRCKLEIENNQETQAEYWAREIGWAVNKILSDDQPLNWKHIRSLTNMRKRDLITCFPYLDFNLRHLISELI